MMGTPARFKGMVYVEFQPVGWEKLDEYIAPASAHWFARLLRWSIGRLVVPALFLPMLPASWIGQAASRFTASNYRPRGEIPAQGVIAATPDGRFWRVLDLDGRCEEVR